MKPKIIRIVTSSVSLDKLLEGQLRYLNQYYEVIGVSSDVGSLKNVGKREGIRVINLPMKREINIVKDFFSLFEIIRLLKKENPQIVHANTPKASLLSMLAAWLCKIPIRIYTVTGLRFETEKGLLRELLIGMEKITCSCATKIIPEGDGVAKTLGKYKITCKPLRKIHNGNINGINLSYFNPEFYKKTENKGIREILKIKETDFVFIYIGRLVKDKGITELINSFVEVYSENKNVFLLLVGPLEQKIDPLPNKIIEKIYNHAAIKFVGRHDDIRPFLLASDIFVFPSYREGFPNAVLQAGAMGLPCIVSNINGCNEIIIDGENGLIVPPKNSTRLFKAMSRLLNDENLRTKLAENARPMIASRYDQKAFWAELLKTYQEYLSNANLVNEKP